MIKKFLGDSFLYILASMFTKGIGFLLLPLYVNELTQFQYGQLDYLSALILLFSVLVSTEISQGVLRYVADINTDEQSKSLYITSSIVYTLFTYAIFLIFIIFLSEKISKLIFDSEDFAHLIIFAAFACFSHSLLYLSTVIYRSKLMVKNAVLLSASSAFFVGIFAFYFLIIEKLGLTGIFLSQILGQLLVSVFSFVLLRKNFIFIRNLNPLMKLLSFSFPLVFSSIGVIISMFADRVILKEMINLEAVAIYGVAAKVASVASIGVMGFQNALSPLIYNQLNNPDLIKKIKLLSGVYFLFTIITVLFLLVFSDGIIILVASEEYLAGSAILVILCCAVLTQAAAMFFPGLSIEGKTVLLSKLNIMAAVLNIILNISFIPLLGALGAALATLLSAFVYLTLNAFYSEKYYPIFKA